METYSPANIVAGSRRYDGGMRSVNSGGGIHLRSSYPGHGHLSPFRIPRLPRSPGRASSLVARASGRGRRWFEDGAYGQYGRSEFGPFPWEASPRDPGGYSEGPSLEELVTFVTSEGVFTLQSKVHGDRGDLFGDRGGRRGWRRPRRAEAEYMDPVQQLCLGAVFGIRAFNGVSEGRYFCVDGFCRSVHMLSDVIADAVTEEGGEVLVSDVSSSGGLNERLRLTVVLPLLWGVPPKRESLRKAIHEGGGIVHRCFQEWQFM